MHKHIKRPENGQIEKLFNEDSWRVFRIISEFVEGFEELSQIGSCVTMFGSARVKKGDRDYEFAREIAKLLVKAGYGVITGGGPGMMEAANRGAIEAGGKTLGLNISLPFEQFPNPYITPELNFEFHYFFMRKFWFMYLAKALVIFPGGFGTMDELFEVLTLVQTKKLQKEISVLIYGQEYWNDIINFRKFVEWGTISEEDYQLIHFADTVDEAFDYLTNDMQRKFLDQRRFWYM